MGKSDKKVKGDRVEAIRKKFEAFLEEDKKRKQRNEYILGKLDKMCTCKALVPQYKPNLYIDVHGTQLHNRHVPLLNKYSSNMITYSHVDNFNLPNLKDDSQIIQEIVQKFILIPKRQTTGEVNVEQQKQQHVQPKSATDDINWKSKYDILNQLKENETEPTKLITASNEIPTKDTKEQPNIDLNESKRYPATHLNLPDAHSLNTQKLPGPEDSAPIQSSHNHQKCDDSRLEGHGDFMTQERRKNVKYDIDDQLKSTDTIEENKSNLDTNIHYLKQPTKGHIGDSSEEFLNNHNNYHIKSLEYAHNDYQRIQDNFVNDNTNTEFLQDNGFSSSERKPPTEPINEFNNPIQQNTETSEQSESIQYPLNIIQPEAFIIQDGVVLENGVNINPIGYEGNKQAELMQCPVEGEVNSGDIILNDDVALEDGRNMNYEGYEENEQSQRMQYPIHDVNSEKFTSNDGVILENRVNTNSEGYEGASNYGIVTLSDQPGNIGDTVVHEPTEIEENSAISKGIEEFEAEQRDMWHESPGENVAYSQEAHEQPNQYYYEQMQEYPVDVNEHEETQENYDQSYEQQYGNQYEAEYQQETQQYDQSQAFQEGYEQNYEAQPVYYGDNEGDSNYQQEQIHETPQSIERELDKEQGFVEKDIEETEAPETNMSESLSNTGVDPAEIK